MHCINTLPTQTINAGYSFMFLTFYTVILFRFYKINITTLSYEIVETQVWNCFIKLGTRDV